MEIVWFLGTYCKVYKTWLKLPAAFGNVFESPYTRNVNRAGTFPPRPLANPQRDISTESWLRLGLKLHHLRWDAFRHRLLPSIVVRSKRHGYNLW